MKTRSPLWLSGFFFISHRFIIKQLAPFLIQHRHKAHHLLHPVRVFVVAFHHDVNALPTICHELGQNGVILDSEVIYDASAYVQQILDSQAAKVVDSDEVAPKLVAGEGGQEWLKIQKN